MTGIAWLCLRYFGGRASAFGWEPSRWQIWWLRLHGATAVFGLMLIGSLVGRHALPAISQRRNLASGLTLGLTLGVLAASGYLLYYLIDDDARRWASLIHWTVGLALLVAFPAHLARSRWRRRAIKRPDSPG